jgi:hypothetical protein
MALGDLLDVDAAHVAEEHHRLLADAVPHDARVVLLPDPRLGIHQHAARQVAVDLQAEHLRGLLRRLVGRVGELHPAGLHPPAREHLRLDDHRLADAHGDLARLLRGGGEAEVGDGNPRALDDLARLVLEEPHAGAPAIP